MEVIIYVGMDTVELKGKYYDTLVKDGEQVHTGQKLMSFDIDKIAKAGYSVVIPIAITNRGGFSEITMAADSGTYIQTGQELLRITK